jgi:hypothetical protein
MDFLHLEESFGKFYSELGKSFWQIDEKESRPKKLKVVGNQTYHITKNIELGKKSPKDKKYEISHVLNSYGFRSDEFNKNTSSNNYLYAGCSYTFGAGMNLENIWPHLTNKKLGGDMFLNLGVTGGSTHRIIMNVINYIRFFGAPKGIFILFPDLTRVDVFTKNSRITVNTERTYGNVGDNSSDFDREITRSRDLAKKVLTYERLFYDFCFSMINLEVICKLSGTSLRWGTWDSQLNKYLIDRGGHNFSGFVDILNEKNVEKIMRENHLDVEEIVKHHPYAEVARDEEHPGALAHYIYSKSFLNSL